MIYDEQVNKDEYYNQDIYYKNKKNDKMYTCDLKVEKETNYKSKSIDLNLENDCSEKCIDIQMDEVKNTRIFGTVKDRDGNVVKNKKLTIFRAELINYKTQYIPVYNVTTDEKGEYEAVIEDYSGENYYMAKVAEDNYNK